MCSMLQYEVTGKSCVKYSLISWQLSEVSEIPVAEIEIAKGRGTFPCELSVLEMQSELDWNPSVETLGEWPLYINDDGAVLYYR